MPQKKRTHASTRAQTKKRNRAGAKIGQAGKRRSHATKQTTKQNSKKAAKVRVYSSPVSVAGAGRNTVQSIHPMMYSGQYGSGISVWREGGVQEAVARMHAWVREYVSARRRNPRLLDSIQKRPTCRNTARAIQWLAFGVLAGAVAGTAGAVAVAVSIFAK